MNSEDWVNIADCANKRVQSKSFNFDCEDMSLVGDLETREMAKAQAYRESLLMGAYMEVTMELARALDRKELLNELESQTVTGIEIRVLTA